MSDAAKEVTVLGCSVARQIDRSRPLADTAATCLLSTARDTELTDEIWLNVLVSWAHIAARPAGSADSASLLRLTWALPFVTGTALTASRVPVGTPVATAPARWPGTALNWARARVVARRDPIGNHRESGTRSRPVRVT